MHSYYYLRLLVCSYFFVGYLSSFGSSIHVRFPSICCRRILRIIHGPGVWV
jgi:hypothetical protein